jgi:hypothetical protein
MTIIPGWLLGQGRFWSHCSRSRGYLAAARGTVASRLGVAGGYERSSHGTGRLAAVVEQRNWAVLAVQGSESVVEVEVEVEVGAQYGCRATAVKDLSQDILENLDPKL